jgi:hypothetical protein
MLRSKSKENSRSQVVPGAALATAPGVRTQENRGTRMPPARNHRCHHARAARWGAAEFRSSEEMACMTYGAIIRTAARSASRLTCVVAERIFRDAESAGSKLGGHRNTNLLYSPSSPSACCLVKAFISCSLILIFPDFSICSRRFAMNRPNNSDCLFCTRASRI